jgi:hypothetical protein
MKPRAPARSWSATAAEIVGSDRRLQLAVDALVLHLDRKRNRSEEPRLCRSGDFEEGETKAIFAIAYKRRKHGRVRTRAGLRRW